MEQKIKDAFRMTKFREKTITEVNAKKKQFGLYSVSPDIGYVLDLFLALTLYTVNTLDF